MSSFFSQFFRDELGVDLGTMNTLIYSSKERNNSHIVLNQPTVVTTARNGSVIAVGSQAKKMLGLNPGDMAPTRPMREGTVNRPYETTQMLKAFLAEASNPLCLFRPRVAVAVPSRIPEALADTLRRCVKDAGAGEIRLVEEPLAAALGANLAVNEPTANMIVDIGGGTAEIAIISLGGVVHCNSVPFAGDAMDAAIQQHVRDVYNLEIGELMAEEIKIGIGSALPADKLVEKMKRTTFEASGLVIDKQRDNRPGTVTLTAEEVREALMLPIHQIEDGISKTLNACKPELAGALVVNGLTLTGGGSLIRGLDAYLSQKFNMLVHRDPKPMQAVVRGLGKLIDEGHLFERPQAPIVGINVR